LEKGNLLLGRQKISAEYTSQRFLYCVALAILLNFTGQLLRPPVKKT